MIKKTSLVLLSFIFLVTQPHMVFAQDVPKEGEYLSVKKGDKVPYDGFLFDVDGLIKIMVNKSLEIEKLTITKDSEINKLKIELEANNKQHALELKIMNDFNKSMISLRDDRIKALEDGHKWDNLKLFGSLLLGIGLSIAVFFASVQITTIRTQ